MSKGCDIDQAAAIAALEPIARRLGCDVRTLAKAALPRRKAASGPPKVRDANVPGHLGAIQTETGAQIVTAARSLGADAALEIAAPVAAKRVEKPAASTVVVVDPRSGDFAVDAGRNVEALVERAKKLVPKGTVIVLEPLVTGDDARDAAFGKLLEEYATDFASAPLTARQCEALVKRCAALHGERGAAVPQRGAESRDKRGRRYLVETVTRTTVRGEPGFVIEGVDLARPGRTPESYSAFRHEYQDNEMGWWLNPERVGDPGYDSRSIALNPLDYIFKDVLVPVDERWPPATFLGDARKDLVATLEWYNREDLAILWGLKEFPKGFTPWALKALVDRQPDVPGAHAIAREAAALRQGFANIAKHQAAQPMKERASKKSQPKPRRAAATKPDATTVAPTPVTTGAPPPAERYLLPLFDDPHAYDALADAWNSYAPDDYRLLSSEIYNDLQPFFDGLFSRSDQYAGWVDLAQKRAASAIGALVYAAYDDRQTSFNALEHDDPILQDDEALLEAFPPFDATAISRYPSPLRWALYTVFSPQTYMRSLPGGLPVQFAPPHADGLTHLEITGSTWEVPWPSAQHYAGREAMYRRVVSQIKQMPPTLGVVLRPMLRAMIYVVDHQVQSDPRLVDHPQTRREEFVAKQVDAALAVVTAFLRTRNPPSIQEYARQFRYRPERFNLGLIGAWESAINPDRRGLSTVQHAALKVRAPEATTERDWIGFYDRTSLIVPNMLTALILAALEEDALEQSDVDTATGSLWEEDGEGNLKREPIQDEDYRKRVFVVPSAPDKQPRLRIEQDRPTPPPRAAKPVSDPLPQKSAPNKSASDPDEGGAVSKEKPVEVAPKKSRKAAPRSEKGSPAAREAGIQAMRAAAAAPLDNNELAALAALLKDTP